MDSDKLNKFIELTTQKISKYKKVYKNDVYFTMQFKTVNGDLKNIVEKKEKRNVKNFKQTVLSLLSLHNDNNIVKTINIEIFDAESNKQININQFTFDEINAGTTQPNSQPTHDNPLNGLNGAQIQEFVNEKIQIGLEAEKKRREYEENLKELNELRQKTPQLEAKIDELENTIEELESEIESKNSIKAIAGSAGALLESIGIPREVVGKRLAGILGAAPEDVERAANERRAEENGTGNHESAPQSPQEQTINVIVEQLYTLPEQDLAKIYMIIAATENNADALQKMFDLSKLYVN